MGWREGRGDGEGEREGGREEGREGERRGDVSRIAENLLASCTTTRNENTRH